jgi:hypothetical protein
VTAILGLVLAVIGIVCTWMALFSPIGVGFSPQILLFSVAAVLSFAGATFLFIRMYRRMDVGFGPFVKDSIIGLFFAATAVFCFLASESLQLFGLLGVILAFIFIARAIRKYRES